MRTRSPGYKEGQRREGELSEALWPRDPGGEGESPLEVGKITDYNFSAGDEAGLGPVPPVTVVVTDAPFENPLRYAHPSSGRCS